MVSAKRIEIILRVSQWDTLSIILVFDLTLNGIFF